MLIWLAFAIPLVTILFLLIFFRRRTLWWEFVIPIVVCGIVITACKFGTEFTQTMDVEYWGGWVTSAEYYESWDETVPCTHEITESEYDSDGNYIGERFVGYEHIYDVDYHGPYWQINDSNGFSTRISESHWNELVRRFGNKRFVDLHRDYHLNDGDKHVTSWDGEDATLLCYVSKHRYENRVQASQSVFNFQEVDPQEYGLFEYPEINNYRCKAILGYSDPAYRAAAHRLDIINAKLGARKKIRAMILVFADKPMAAAVAQQNYWKNGNKNELIICVGVDKQKQVQWSYVFSWTEVEKLKVDVRSKVIEQAGETLNLLPIIEWLGPEIEEHWVKKSFDDFDYLTVEPPTWMVVLTFVLTILASAISSLWVVHNQYREGMVQRRRYRRRY
jgi:hypothetical protein